MKELFRENGFRKSTFKIVQLCDAICDEYQEQNLRLTLRQLYYQFIGRDLFPADWVDDAYNAKHGLTPGTKNTEKNYKRLGGLVSDGRLAARIDWEAIEDRVRRPLIWAEYNSIREPVEDAIAGFRLPRWKGQTHYVELWVEKDALAGVLRPLAEQFHVTLMVNRGYSSQSAMYDAGNRFKRRKSKRCHILYLGDHDPSGEDMVRDIQDRLDMFGADVEVEKVALTIEQVHEYKPPPNPAKITDSRAAAYIAKHGPHSWEVDALDPKTLQALIKKALAKYVHWPTMSAVIAEETKLREKLETFLEGIEE